MKGWNLTSCNWNTVRKYSNNQYIKSVRLSAVLKAVPCIFLSIECIQLIESLLGLSFIVIICSPLFKRQQVRPLNRLQLGHEQADQRLWSDKIRGNLDRHVCVSSKWEWDPVTGPVWPRVFQEFYAPRFPWHSAHEGGEVVSPSHRPPLPPGNVRGTHFH
jgi:hypothetical protein